jgi:hypothetical protein
VAINVAVLRAQVARGKVQQGVLCAAGQFAAAEELKVRGLIG